MKKKIYIEFCNYDFSILSATPLGKFSIGTATTSLKVDVNRALLTSQHPERRRMFRLKKNSKLQIRCQVSLFNGAGIISYRRRKASV